MENLSDSFEKLKTDYRSIFLSCASNIEKEILQLKPKNFVGDIFDSYELNSTGYLWQKSVLEYLDNILNVDIVHQLKLVKNSREEFNCCGCGTCCRFACSEFSYEQLKQKAKNGDNYAAQFISVFEPYKSIDEVRAIFSEYVDLLIDNVGDGFYFYYCPKVTENNRCPDYENRPQICRDFPDNPIAFLPLTCGYLDWKLKSERVLLKLNALAEIVEFYKNNIKGN